MCNKLVRILDEEVNNSYRNQLERAPMHASFRWNNNEDLWGPPRHHGITRNSMFPFPYIFTKNYENHLPITVQIFSSFLYVTSNFRNDGFEHDFKYYIK